MVNKKQIIDGYNTIPGYCEIGIDDGGYCFQVNNEPDVYLEIGVLNDKNTNRLNSPGN